MKLAWAILCSLVLMTAPMLMAEPNPVCVRHAAHACCHAGGKMSCCATQPVSNSPPVPLNSNRAGLQTGFIAVLLPALTAALAVVENRQNSFAPLPPPTANGVPLYTRNCARLI